MYAEVCGQGNTANEEEEHIDGVEGDHSEGNGKAFHDGGADQVEQGEHSENGDEHGVVDNGVIAGESVGDDVARQREDEEGHEKLARPSQFLRVGGGGSWRRLTWKPRRASWMICMLRLAVKGRRSGGRTRECDGANVGEVY